MSPSRIALIVGGSTFIVAWITAATTARQPGVVAVARDAVDRAASSPVEPSPAVAGLADEVSRLRDRLGHTPEPAEAVRNPFSLAPVSAVPRAGPPSAAERLQAARVVDGAAGPRAPVARLVGVAIDATSPNRVETATAILTLPAGEVLLVGVGDPVPGGYRVDAIDPSGATLVDATGTRHRLALP